jgi:hypothetical protein
MFDQYSAFLRHVFVRGANNEDLSPLIDRVVFQLHPSFNNPTRVLDQVLTASYAYLHAIKVRDSYRLAWTTQVVKVWRRGQRFFTSFQRHAQGLDPVD